MFGIFGKKKQTKQTGSPSLSNGSGADSADSTRLRPAENYPWRDHHDYAACNFALGHLHHNLLNLMTIDGRIHAETCLAAIGAISGFAAQRALFARISEENDTVTISQIQSATTKNGANFYFGEPLNQMLFPQSDADANGKLWSHAAGGAVSAGLDPNQLPQLGDFFSHVAANLGGELEGIPSVSRDHYPQLPAKELLTLTWPLALMCFGGRFPNSQHDFGAASARFWPAISAHVAGALITKTQPALDPAIGLTIVMESAIYASKLDPASVGPSAS